MSIQIAAKIIQRGGIVAYATEHCFGLGCDPWNWRTVERLFQIKHRPPDKGLIIIAADPEQLAPFVTGIPERAAKSWPGPYTWLLDPRPNLPHWIIGRNPHVAVRITAHPQAARLCRAAGQAIVSTSANRTGQVPAHSYREVLRRFGASVDYVLPGMVGDLSAPTSIRNSATGATVRS